MKEQLIFRNVRVWDIKADQAVLIDVDVSIDVDQIVRDLAIDAYNNKKRLSRALNGMVEVRMRGTIITPARKTA